MPDSINPFAAELRSLASRAGAADRIPTLREIEKVSGIGRTQIGQWLRGSGLPRSWDDGADVVVTALFKIAVQNRRPIEDEEASRSRCRDAYHRAKREAPKEKEPEPEPVARRNRRPVVLGVGAATAVLLIGGGLWWTSAHREEWRTAPISPLATALSGKCLTPNAAGGIEQYTCTDAQDQNWQLARPEAAVSEVVVLHVPSGRCLAASGQQFSGVRLAALADCDDPSATRWRIAPGDRKRGWTYLRLTHVERGLCLDVYGNNPSDGTTIVLWSCVGAVNQLFRVRDGSVPS